ncbi:MAG: hypothetical protein FJ276_21925 [Planctomycetes bacterium]|nr:hypothetical protein [Planctomycetota bacterium]
METAKPTETLGVFRGWLHPTEPRRFLLLAPGLTSRLIHWDRRRPFAHKSRGCPHCDELGKPTQRFFVPLGEHPRFFWLLEGGRDLEATFHECRRRYPHQPISVRLVLELRGRFAVRVLADPRPVKASEWFDLSPGQAEAEIDAAYNR